jgi:hypothetical protein
MSEPRSGGPGSASEYEKFFYLLAEMERAIERGTLAWSVASAEAAHHRLEKRLTALLQIGITLRVD